MHTSAHTQHSTTIDNDARSCSNTHTRTHAHTHARAHTHAHQHRNPYHPPTPPESTDLDVEARDPRDLGVYVFGERTALHVGFQGPGWTLDKSPETGYIFSLVDYAR